MRPVAKSIYNERRMVSLNGSLNSTMRSPGFATYDAMKAKGMTNSIQQIQMAQTFNLNILDKNVGKGNTTTRAADGVSPDLSIDHGGNAVRSMMNESTAAFTINTESKIPDLSETRRDDREER